MPRDFRVETVSDLPIPLPVERGADEYFAVPQDPAAEEPARPIKQYIIKAHSRCNLACTYCTIYMHPDQTWRRRDREMSAATFAQTGERMAEHAEQYGLEEVEAILHGGEPTLLGRKGIAAAVSTLRGCMPAGVRMHVGMQTNATLLDRPLLDTLREHGVRVGVSLDGPPEVNDKFRIYPNGRGSSEDTIRGLTLLSEEYPDVRAGMLCVVNPFSDPVAAYDSLVSYKPGIVDFLLPHHNWSNRPPGREAGAHGTPYGDWLIKVFDHWISTSGSRAVDVPLFRAIMGLAIGLPSTSEVIGITRPSMIVIETGGEIELVDSLKTTYEGATATGLNVRDNSFAEALNHPILRAMRAGRAALSQTCQTCPIVSACGGGYYTHRWHEANGFRNPSVYCPDLAKVIVHIVTNFQLALDEAGARRSNPAVAPE
jgi:uncharacterized protein